MTHRTARTLAVAALASGALALTAAPSQAFPTEHVTITVTVGANYSANVTVAGGTPTEVFDINIVRVDSAGPRTAGCSGAQTCHIDGALGSATLPAVFAVHVVGGQRTLFDNVLDSYVQTTVCTTTTSCTSSPVILSLG